ncbi:MAG: hypothetical protein IPH42_12345 [Bacteroidetes bacterium]|nr:hypothetical protein [Bacteroidota bacterium]
MESKSQNLSSESGINLKLILPYLGSLFIFFGVINSVTYYQSFGIRILEYMQFSEILTAFLDDISALLLTSAITILQILDAYSNNNSEKFLKFRAEMSTTDNFRKQCTIIYKNYKNAINTLLALTCIFIISASLNFISLRYMAALLSIIFILIFIGFGIGRIRQMDHTKLSNIFMPYLWILFAIYLIVFMLSNIKSENVSENKKTYGTKIYMADNKVLFSDSSNYYIGKTNEYFFIYHEKDKYTEVYPMDRVIKIVYKND